MVGGVVVKRSGLAKIIETGPHELTGDERILVLALELDVRHVGPGGRGDVVRAGLKIGAAGFSIIADEREIFAARADAGGRFAADQWEIWVVGSEGRVFRGFVIVAEDVDNI